MLLIHAKLYASIINHSFPSSRRGTLLIAIVVQATGIPTRRIDNLLDINDRRVRKERENKF
jgi:hypothetical protein